MSHYDYTFKILILGDVSSGKEELLKKYAVEKLVGKTIGVKFYEKTISKIRMHLWDISEEERFRFLFPTYCLGSNGAIIMYDITDSNSLKHVPGWVQIIKQKAGLIPILLIGNNLDLEQNREVSKEQIEKLKKEYDISSSMEISVKTGENVEKMFATIITEIIYYLKYDFPRKKLTQEEKDKRVQELIEKLENPPINEVSQEEIFFLKPSKTLRDGSDDFFRLDEMLRKLLAAIPEVKAAMIVSTEGLPIVSALPQGINEAKMAAMTATLLSLAERSVIEMEKGEFEQLYIRGNEGYLLILRTGPNTVLTISTTKDVRLGLIFLDLKRNFEDSDFFPYPYIFKPPRPPGEAGAEAILKPEYISSKKVSGSTLYCKHCGADLSNGESICHACGKKTI